MPHPIYGPPTHELERVDFTLVLPLRANSYHSRVTAHGYSSTKRGALWSITEQHQISGREFGLATVDLLHHVALVALQDRPRDNAALQYGLRGGQSYENETIF